MKIFKLVLLFFAGSNFGANYPIPETFTPETWKCFAFVVVGLFIGAAILNPKILDE